MKYNKANPSAWTLHARTLRRTFVEEERPWRPVHNSDGRSLRGSGTKRSARSMAQNKEKMLEETKGRMSLDDLFSQIQEE